MKIFGYAVMGLVLTILTIATCFWVTANQKTVTEEEFLNFKDEVRERFQRTEAKLDTLQATANRCESDLDTLKQGQEVIFDQVKKNNGTSFWDFLK